MGFLLFFRATLDSLKRINSKEAQLMSLMSRQRKIQNEIADMKRIQNNMQSIWETAASSAASNASTTYNLAYNSQSGKMNEISSNLSFLNSYNAANATQDDQKKYTGLLKDKTIEDVKNDFNKQLEQIQKQQETEQQKAFQIYTVETQRISSINKAAQSVFESSNEFQLRYLNREDSEISTEKESLEGELEVLRQEYENEKKARSDAAKNIAPTFGQ